MSSVRSPHRRHDRDYFYKYVTLETAHRIIASKSLRWSSPLLFNDPFDVPREATLGFTSEELAQATVDEFVSALEGPGSIKSPQRALLAKLFRSDTDPTRRRAVIEYVRGAVGEMATRSAASLEAFRAAWDHYVPELRILCLSEVNDCAPMWSHYSANHRGVVLKFVASDELDSSLLLAQPVVYQDAPPKLPPKEEWARWFVREEEIDWQEFFREYYYTKAKPWSYEREWRVISYAPNEAGLYSDRGFHPHELVGVFLGCEVSEANASDLVSALSHGFEHVEAYRARLDPRNRSIVFYRIER